MELRDLFVTPVVIMAVLMLAYIIRPYATDENTRRYFFPALIVKIAGALAIGFIYQYYYNGGDTFKYHTYGSRILWKTLFESPEDFFNLLFFGNGTRSFNKFFFIIPVLRDPPSFFTARIVLLADLFTVSTYSGSAVIFAFASFLCIWRLFMTFYKKYRHLHKSLAIAILFMPSVFFWGSGIMKDTITFACLALATALVMDFYATRKYPMLKTFGTLTSLYFLFAIKKYILFCFVPSILMWIILFKASKFRSNALKIILTPFAALMIIISSYYAVVKLGEGDSKYEASQLAKTAQITAYDIRYQTGREAGSGYDLGETDGSFRSLIRLIPQGINVSLFRPYLWEVKNPLMLMTSLESFFLLCLTLYVIRRAKWKILTYALKPDILFCLTFSITFAFAVGASTYNFGTLARYKIPLLPFYALSLILILDQVNSDKNARSLEGTE